MSQIKAKTGMDNIELMSELTCPKCSYRAMEKMPTDNCLYYYECKKCHILLKPKPGDCCVFCSYGTVPCPPIQKDSCCSTTDGN